MIFYMEITNITTYQYVLKKLITIWKGFLQEVKFPRLSESPRGNHFQVDYLQYLHLCNFSPSCIKNILENDYNMENNKLLHDFHIFSLNFMANKFGSFKLWIYVALFREFSKFPPGNFDSFLDRVKLLLIQRQGNLHKTL